MDDQIHVGGNVGKIIIKKIQHTSISVRIAIGLTYIILTIGPYFLIFTPNKVSQIPVLGNIVPVVPVATFRFQESDYPFVNEETKRVAAILYSANEKDNISSKLALQSMYDILSGRLFELPNITSSTEASALALALDIRSMKDDVSRLIDKFSDYPTDKQGVANLLDRFDNLISRSNEYRTSQKP